MKFMLITHGLNFTIALCTHTLPTRPPRFVEDINNVLNAGEVPNIFPVEEKMEICDGVRRFAKAEFGKSADDMNAQVAW